MKKEERKILYDTQLQIEAYQFKGIMQKFPNHFHDYYVIGFIEAGRRHLSCGGKEYDIDGGDIILINPGENHSCEQLDMDGLDYRCLNIKEETMEMFIREAAGIAVMPEFTDKVVYRSDLVILLKELHQMIMGQNETFEKEEKFYFLMESLIDSYTNVSEKKKEDTTVEIQLACDYMEKNFADTVTLERLSDLTSTNKYTLIRNFTKQKGVTPYQYLESVRIREAKKMLEEGKDPLEAAMDSGFTDQSHFSRFFKNLIGLTPKQYQNIFRNGA